MANTSIRITYPTDWKYGGTCTPAEVTVRKSRVDKEEAVEISMRGTARQAGELKNATLTLTTDLAEAIAHTVLAVTGQSEVPVITLKVQG